MYRLVCEISVYDDYLENQTPTLLKFYDLMLKKRKNNRNTQQFCMTFNKFFKNILKKNRFIEFFLNKMRI